jgi:transposase
MINLDLISTREVARKLGVTPQTVARRVRAGELAPAVRGVGVRGPLWFDAEQIEALVSDTTPNGEEAGE